MELSPAESMNLLRFVCSFAWSDLRVSQKERDLVMRIVGYLRLGDREVAQVEQWLRVPPTGDEVDPTQVPRAHREMFLRAAEKVVEADGSVVPAEKDALVLFRQLLKA